MEKIILVANWLTYGLLFFAFFIKSTDNRERDVLRKTVYISLCFWTLFMSVYMFKMAFFHAELKAYRQLSFFQTIFNLLVLVLMCSKIKDDKIFIKKKVKNYDKF